MHKNEIEPNIGGYLEALTRYDDPVLLALADAFIARIRHDPNNGPGSLEMELGLSSTGPGKQDAFMRAKIAMRNGFYAQAWRLIVDENGCTPNQAAKILNSEIKRFSIVYSRIKAGNREPKNELERLLTEAFSLDCRCEGLSANRLYQIFRKWVF